ncbi:MAG: hypothetical protein JWL59_4337 [Chthoniobacteraceae bacterium]|nr:hypothetical protein [Chthoniobacteraceae bacterium]
MSVTVLDYGRPNPFGETIGRPRNLAWPVNAYRVTLPKASDGDDGLNAFERVILKLLDAVGALDAGALADETRIPIDLVKGILLRLRDKSLIDERNVIIQPKREDRESKEEKVPVFATALLYRELVTGRILPFLHFLDENPLRKREEERFIKTLRADSENAAPPPVPRDVIGALRAMKRWSEARGSSEKFPAVEKITIAQQPERHHLDCPIAIPKSESEFRIADPFGNGFSLILESAFERLLEQDGKLAGWLREWKQSLRDPRPPKRDDPDERPKEPFDTDANQQRFPKLVANLRKPKNAAFRSISTIYASLEWALFYACRRLPFEGAIAKLQFAAQSEQPELIGNAAHHLGLTPPERKFNPLLEKKLQDFRNGEAELQTLLSIAILQAENDWAHPLHRIASTHPDLLIRLSNIKKSRDEKRHGQGKADAADLELADDAFMREIVHALLPEISFSDTPAAGPDQDARADSLLEARDSIQGEFGFRSFNLLGANLQDRLICAERFWMSCVDGDDALVFARDLYAAVQSAFAKHLAGKLPPDVHDSELANVAARKAADAGLGGTWPVRLRTVKISFIRQSMQGADQSLGACTIAFLLIANGETLRAVANSQPTFIDDVDIILTRSGHGNEPLPLPKADIAKLRKASYTTIKTLFEA